MMQKHLIHHLPVVDGDRLVGIVTLSDLRSVFPLDTPTLSAHEVRDMLNKISAEDIMTTAVITVTPETAVAEAARLMMEHRVSSLPVVERNRLLGIITEHDMYRAIAAGLVPLHPVVHNPLRMHS